MTEHATPSAEDAVQQEQLFVPADADLDADDSRTPYEVLDGYVRDRKAPPGQGEISGDELREWYISMTDELIYEMEGHEGAPKPDYVIFLDKSARPVAWLVKELWPVLAREPGSEYSEEPVVPPMPEFKFLNIDREQWQPLVGDFQSEGIDTDAISERSIDALRGLFATKFLGENEETTEDTETIFDDKEVLIVDEVGVTGATIAITRSILERAFPTARFRTHHWMSPEIAQNDTARFNKDVPVWYSEATNLGRGVGDRKIRESKESPSSAQRRGAEWLSTRWKEPDEAANQLRKEFKQLAEDAENGDVLVFPSVMRDDHIERAELANHLPYDQIQATRFKPHN